MCVCVCSSGGSSYEFMKLIRYFSCEWKRQKANKKNVSKEKKNKKKNDRKHDRNFPIETLRNVFCL